ncbi:uncharacterized protein LOC126368758 [Pectinophora gossypiella]|uniref:uncharacterized protein LOC126368758 n=1 Tax=Pectinophora gossypiella TaxID=13191 RepID=UPI00214EECBE|nr:uncharacterized protein LOC126368758 [Pectinophora gossypiella]
MNRNIFRFRNFIQSNKSSRFCSNKTKKALPEELMENEPIKFSTSLAARKTVRPVVKKTKIDMPWYQPYSVIGSVTVFLIYFCLLREENDMDGELTKTLYERMQGLEKVQLLQSYQFNKEHGKSVVEIEKRLKEIEEQERQQATSVA